MIQHYSFRVPWHDNGWDGTVCKDPAHNLSCLRLKNILENRNDEFELKNCGQCMQNHENDLSCIQESSAFMSEKELRITEIHPYKENNPDTHSHFYETEVVFPPYSFSARPFNWLLNKNIQNVVKYYGVDYDGLREPVLPFENAWIQDADNHKAIFDYFYGDIVPGKSLCIAYAKQVPFIDEPRRVVVAIGHITGVEPAVEHNHTDEKPLRSLTWETRVCHSIRKDNADGFIIPYNEMMKYADDHPGFDIRNITVFAPDDAFDEFSYATEHVSYDAAIEVIESCIKSFKIISECLNKDYSNVIEWLNERLSEVWDQRGVFPGLGPMLCAFGINKGILIEKEIKDNYKNDNLWDVVERMFDDPRSVLSKSLAKEIPVVFQASWNHLGERKKLFRLLSRFSLSINQAIKIFNNEERQKSGLGFTDEDILNNPYVLYEKTRLKEATSEAELYFSIKKVDRALFPVEKLAKQYPLEEPSRLSSDNDQRRIRAIAVAVLEKEAQNGNTILPCNLLAAKMKDISVRPECIVTSDILNGLHTYLNEEILKREMKDGTDYYKLARINTFDKLIEQRVRKRINAEKIEIRADWMAMIDKAFGSTNDNEEEIRARKEKAAVLDEIAKSKISVLVGGAGTGKTTLLSILCSHPDIKNGGVLLLAPTGKATVRLKESMQTSGNSFKALNVAQFLMQNKRFNWKEMRYTLSDHKCDDVPNTVIIDESSMLTEEMFGALLDALARAKRIIFVGDPHQLPPIGAGRPFVDLVELLKLNLSPNAFPKACNCYGELTVNRRQKGKETRLDVELAKNFDGDDSDFDEDVMASIISGKDKNIKFIKWTDKNELRSSILDVSSKILNMNDEDDLIGFNKALGANLNNGYCYFNKGSASNLEKWQIIAPTRGNPQGTLNINRIFHEKYRKDFINLAKSKAHKIPRPFGNDGIVYGDKVINVVNTRAEAYPKQNAENYIANGEVGIVCDCFGKDKNKWFTVEFSSQPGFTYSIDPRKAGGSDDRESNLELAYALTVHKAQGSQFKSVVLVVGEPCSLMSRELIYTALTRQENSIAILYNDDPYSLLRYSSDSYSEISKRFTDLFAETFVEQGIDFRPNVVENNGVFYEDRLIHRTVRGELVRSKSEVIIANALYQHKLDYEYEPDLLIEGKLYKPDFKVEDYDTGIAIYIEHCGMMNDPKYRKRWENKKKMYEKNGIIEGKNLLVTYDQTNGGIDSKEINDLIVKTFDL